MAASDATGRLPRFHLLEHGRRLLPRWLFPCLLLLALVSGCGGDPAARIAPTPTFDFEYSGLPRATPRPVTPLPTESASGQDSVSFSGAVLPILEQNCARCHGGIAGMWLTDYEHVLLGGDNGPAVRPGDPEASPLYIYTERGLMPPDTGPLSPDDVETLRRWIEEGAAKN